MKPLFFLSHHDAHARVLVGPDLDHLVEVARNALPPTALERRGFWVDPGGQRVLLAATQSGPVLQVAGQTVPLAETAFTVHRGKGDDRRCSISVHGQLLAEIRYRTPPSTGSGWEADEDFTDFFSWLADHSRNAHFLAYDSDVP